MRRTKRATLAPGVIDRLMELGELRAEARIGTLYKSFRLSGDEDCGVGLHCLHCDTGGEPIAYYAGISEPYADRAHVVKVSTISGLLEAAKDHAGRSHPRGEEADRG